jgi:hypothetical protein
VISLQSFYVAATVVTLLQWLRVRERRLLALLALFACLMVAHHQGDWFAARPYHYAAGVCGLGLLVWLSPRAPAARR